MKAKDIDHLHSALTTLKLIDVSMPWFLTKEENETTLYYLQSSSPQCSSIL